MKAGCGHHLEGWVSLEALGSQLLPHSTCLLHSLQSIDPGQQFTWENSNLEVNKPKNRYANVIAYDHSRVILTSVDGELREGPPPIPLISSSLGGISSSRRGPQVPGRTEEVWRDWVGGPRVMLSHVPSCLFIGVPGSDYINANYIDGYRKQNAYIATQGPLPETMGDFWRMVWEQRTATVVMMTRLEEKSRVRLCRALPRAGEGGGSGYSASR